MSKLGGEILCLIASMLDQFEVDAPAISLKCFREPLNSLVDLDLLCEIGICTLWHLFHLWLPHLPLEVGGGRHATKGLLLLAGAAMASNNCFKRGHGPKSKLRCILHWTKVITAAFIELNRTVSAKHPSLLFGFSQPCTCHAWIELAQPPIWSQMMILKADHQICEMYPRFQM